MLSARQRYFLIFFLLFGGMCAHLRAQTPEVPPEVQYPLLLKVLSFDRNFNNRNKTTVNIALVFQSKFRLSANTKNTIEVLTEDTPMSQVSGKTIKLFPVDLSDGTDVAAFCRVNQISCLYIMPLRAYDLKRITDISRAYKIITFGVAVEQVQSGASCAIGLKNDKPEIIINLPAAKSEGTEFNAQLLKLARIIGD